MRIKNLFAKMSRISIKCYFFIIITVTFYLFVFYLFGFHYGVWFKSWPFNKKSVNLPYVVVHIDLKGAPPKLEYLRSILPDLKSNGANGLLMEYEDMFPYVGKLVNISAKNCYKMAELRAFLEEANEQDIEIIPLVQTFGHLEHVLKLKEFSHLRESPVNADSLCPSKRESMMLIYHMLEQIINFHNNVRLLKHIHIGCDEVYQLNKCPLCIKRQMSNSLLFMEHLQYVSNTVRDLSLDTTVLIWDDMIRPIKPPDWTSLVEEIPRSQIDNIEPVYWEYTPKVTISNHAIYNYKKVFKNTWIASAFKGADGATASIPNLYDRALNHFSWMEAVRKYRNFKGIILTGWSRYSHMDPPCELLPVSYPSLILNLLMIKSFNQGIPLYDSFLSFDAFYKLIMKEYKDVLKCNSVEDINSSNFWVCTFDGCSLMYMLHKYNTIAKEAITKLHSVDTPLSTYEYYSKYNFMNVKVANETLKWCNKTLFDLNAYELGIYRKMKQYYYEDSIQEYVGYKSFSLKRKIKNICENIKTYINNIKYWERNPNKYVFNLPEVNFSITNMS